MPWNSVDACRLPRQAASDYPEVVEFLFGIDIISLNPDVTGKIKKILAKVEERHG